MLNKDAARISISTGTIVRFVLIIVLFYLLYVLKDVVLVILTAIVVASAVEPGTKWFLRRRIPRVIAVLLIYILSAVILVTAFYFLLIPLLNESIDFLQTLPQYQSALAPAPEVNPGTVGNIFQGLSVNFSLPALISQINTALSNISTGFFGTVDVIFGGIISFFLIIAISFYLAVQEDGIGKFLRIVLPLRHEAYFIGLWKRSQQKIGLWMQGQLMLALVVGVLVFLGLTLLQINHALLLGVLAAVFELIPLFGQFLAAAPAVLIAYAQGGLPVAAIVVGLFLIIQQFESQLIYPLVVKKVVGVPPIISIIALVVGAKLAGFLGIILSVPLATVGIEFFNDLERRKIARQDAAKETDEKI